MQDISYAQCTGFLRCRKVSSQFPTIRWEEVGQCSRWVDLGGVRKGIRRGRVSESPFDVIDHYEQSDQRDITRVRFLILIQCEERKGCSIFFVLEVTRQLTYPILNAWDKTKEITRNCRQRSISLGSSTRAAS